MRVLLLAANTGNPGATGLKDTEMGYLPARGVQREKGSTVSSDTQDLCTSLLYRLQCLLQHRLVESRLSRSRHHLLIGRAFRGCKACFLPVAVS